MFLKNRLADNQQIQTRRNNRLRSRRGVTLLFVVSFIVLFLLMGTTFVVVSTQFMRTSTQRTRLQADRTDARTLIYRALYQIIRGPSLDDANSSLRTHSLLADQYGYGARSIIAAASADPTGQLIILQLRSPGGMPNALQDILTGNEFTVSSTTGAYDGLILSFVTNSATNPNIKGISTRIVRYEVDEGNTTFNIYISRKWMKDSLVDPFATPANLVGANIIINGRAFNGSGAGVYDGRITARLTPNLLGNTASATPAETGPLAPNQIGKTRAQLISDYLSNIDPNTGLQFAASMFVKTGGGASLYAQTGFVGGGPNESYDAWDYQNVFLSDGGLTIPSYHRPRLITYAAANGIPAQRVTFRPFYDPTNAATIAASPANADFAASFPDPAVSGYWDVDNDGDGTRDSVLIDIGLPDQYDLSGRRYRPLIAVKIEDLDGRFNVSSHGNLFHTLGRNATDQPLLGLAANASLPRGQFVGPAEVSMRGAFQNVTDYQNTMLLRYGPDNLPGIAGVGTGSIPENWLSYKLYDYPNGVSPTAYMGNAFRSPHNIHGRYGYAYPGLSAADPTIFDVSLLPGLDLSASGLASETANSAYEFDFVSGKFGSSVDTPFLAAELERLYRQFDKDANQLPSRLFNVVGGLGNRANFNNFTTDSYEVPAVAQQLTEILYQALIANGLTPAQANIRLEVLLPLEHIRGMKFNINRPFGNGLDDNTDGQFDEAAELVVPHINGTTNAVFPGHSTRLDYARHLFVIGYLITTPSTPDETRQLAQWIANIVDFRDGDSKNFGFEYDINPANGWNVDGNLATTTEPERGVVWGSERPELLISETLATHDRATEDTDADSTGATTTDPTPDDDFDSHLRPTGLGFIELYNPWNTANNTINQQFPPELYDGSGVDLDRTVNAGGMNVDPVWRLLVVKDAGLDLDPDDPDTTNLPTSTDVERSIYFVQPRQSYNQGGYGDGQQYFTNLAVGSVAPGRYAVLGGFMYQPGAGGYRSTFGRKITATEGDEMTLLLAETRGINLIPGAAQGVQITSADGTGADTTTNYTAVGIVLNQTLSSGTPVNRSFSFSEPVAGYPVAAGASVVDRFRYATAYDLPLDADSTVQEATALAAIANDATTEKFRVIHLQRLADPTQPWNANTNPFITYDKKYVDLTSFNGVTSDTDTNVTNGNTRFQTNERGTSEAGSLAALRRRLWPTEPAATAPSADVNPLAGADSHYFSFQWAESFGRINQAYTAPRDNANAFAAAADAPVSFPWLNWNNRPYTSQYELSLVPVSRQSQLLNVYTLRNTALNPYADPTVPGPYVHLPNFFSGDTVGAASNRLFEFIEMLGVPSKFVGTDDYFAPNSTTPFESVGFPSSLLPPFDRISRYREPGKINLNTIRSATVWNGIMGQADGSAGLYGTAIPFSALVASRNAGTGVLPTAIPSPFKSPVADTHVPIAGLIRNDVGTGVFRPNVAGTAPLFDVNFTGATNHHHNTDRSPFFRYDARQRLGNIGTTRSSVYAIWITVAYFEIDADGKIGAEMGWDTGKIRRNRGFFIVDRSIPVAFEPGTNHNIERMILVESIIE